ncbi:hypothetical protein BCR44DRAFT_1149590 [Catenaria anguillulae PL171]|uniref:Uncharacterized protein n=1 Tax=Catenaria anguillulae PL171 TaxID=765915 RepID=A0A1Y2HJ43_9FUNG|nr:hypothetical protein BCR44DRAFT_1149590 [Catenaria anguillulae PL171]
MIATKTAALSTARHCRRLPVQLLGLPTAAPAQIALWSSCRITAAAGSPCLHTIALETATHHFFSAGRAASLPPQPLSTIDPCTKRHSRRPYSSSPSEQEQQDQERNRHLNMGRAVHVLRNDLDHFCASGLTTTDIYSPDMRFYDPHSRLHLTSLRQYLLASKALRVLLHLYYMNPQLSLTRLVQLRHPEVQDTNLLTGPDDDPLAPEPTGQGGSSTPLLPRDVRDDEDGALRVTFLLTGLPRHRYLVRLLTPMQPLSDADLDQIEGVAMYTFNREGKVHAHWIERLIPRPNLLRYLGGASQWWRGGPKGPGSVDEWRAGWCCEEVKVPASGPEWLKRHHRQGKV